MFKKSVFSVPFFYTFEPLFLLDRHTRTSCVVCVDEIKTTTI